MGMVGLLRALSSILIHRRAALVYCGRCEHNMQLAMAAGFGHFDAG